jgi:tripartite-type tricarboxylate transporter receptor subunit TctC
MPMTRLTVVCACVFVVTLCGFERYPAKPVRLIEPFGAGGGVDLVSRAVGKELSEIWQQPVTVENQPGAGSTAAPAFVARSAPDGYTLLVNSSAQAYARLVKGLPYDPLKDFIAIAPLTSQAYVLVTSAASKITSIADLVTVAKAKPRALKFGSPGIGTGSYVGSEMFNLAAGIQSTHVPSNASDGIVQTLDSLAAGHTDYVMAPIPLAAANVQAGRLRALAVSTKKRSPLLPRVPTVAETGVADLDYAIWYGVWAPARTPTAVVNTLSADIARALAAPDLREWMAKHGADPMKMTPREFARFVQTESERAARVIERARVNPR